MIGNGLLFWRWALYFIFNRMPSWLLLTTLCCQLRLKCKNVIQILEDAAHHMSHLLICFSIVSAPIRMVLQSLSQSTVINGEANIKNILPLLQFCKLVLKLVAPFAKVGVLLMSFANYRLRKN
jgi:hypothetical protein